MTINALYKVRKEAHGDPHANAVTALIRKTGYPELRSIRLEHVLRTEGITGKATELLMPVFAHPELEDVGMTSTLIPPHGPIREVSYQRGMTDPETDSVLHIAPNLNLHDLAWVRLATRIQFLGVDEEVADEITRRFFFNATMQALIGSGESWNTLIPQGRVGGVELFPVAEMDMNELAALSEERRLFLSQKQLETIRRFYSAEGRHAHDGELEMIAARWSDHCSHTTLRALGLFQAIQEATDRIAHPLVVSAFHDNAGAMWFYEGWALCLKGETHISPSSVATYGGIMTKHGGVIRDTLGFAHGAWPWAGTTFMGICDPTMSWEDVPAGALHPLIILLESISGTCDYTNPMGIPMAGWQYLVHPHNVKCFALGHSAGVIPLHRAQKGVPQKDDICLLIGGKTGIDGIHGATVSSGAMTSETASVDGTHVQIGMPIEERKFMEAIPRLRDANCIRAITDCGAAGLSSAVGEMAENTGVKINLAWVDLKCAAMSPWEIWLSESQERMVLAIPPEKLEEALGILDTFAVPRTIIGIFTDTHRCQVVYDASISSDAWVYEKQPGFSGDIVVDLPYRFLDSEAPLPNIPVSRPKPSSQETIWPTMPVDQGRWITTVTKHLGHFNICDQSAAGHQYDQTVQGNTTLSFLGGVDENMPDELFVATPVQGKPWGAGLSNAVNQRYGEVDAAGMGIHVTVQAVAKLVAAGFSPDDIILCGNLYTPKVTDNPEAAWQLVQLVKSGYVPASEALGTPVITGKDSSSGTFNSKVGRIDAPLTVDIAAMGRIKDAGNVLPKAFCNPGDEIYLYTPGLKRPALGGSVFFDTFGYRGDTLPHIDLPEVRKGFVRYHQLVTASPPTARSAIAEGGLMRRLFEMSLGERHGCSIELPTGDPLTWLFGEFSGSIVFTLPAGTINPNWTPLQDGTCQKIGEVVDAPTITVRSNNRSLFSSDINQLAAHWAKTFTEVVS